jgi:hypothetical protein
MPHSETYIDGVWYPSVTTIMSAKPKPWLDAWREKWGALAERKTLIASAIGTEFHRCVEEWLNNGYYLVQPPTVDGVPMISTVFRVMGMMDSFIAWANSVDGKIDRTELKIISRKHVYSGTLDAVGTLGKKHVVYDWKTSGKIYPEMQLQLAAYAEAYNERCESKTDCVKDGLIVCVSKDKPRFKLTTKQFKLGKRVFNKFLKLRAEFDKLKGAENAEGRDSEATSR